MDFIVSSVITALAATGAVFLVLTFTGLIQVAP